MSVPLSQVKPVCTSSELALVRASRAPQLEGLTADQLKQHAQRARKLLDKWQDQSRSQSRTQSRQAGFPELDTRTHLKVRIFSEALKSFEARLAKSPSAGAVESSSPSKPKKKSRSAKHRASRAAVRADLAEAQGTLNAKSAMKKAAKQSAAAAKKPPVAKPSAAPAPAEPAAVQKSGGKASTKKSHSRPALSAIPVAPTKLDDSGAKQRAAVTAAKQSRVTRSGLTTRVKGHVLARGKRAQARRDAKNS